MAEQLENEVTVPPIVERRRLASPTVTPQALAWHRGHLWMGSRDLRRVYQLEADTWRVVREIEPPGIPWAAVSTGRELRFTIGIGGDDDRYIYRYTEGGDFEALFACPDFTGSYLSYDGEDLYLSQWYKGRILKLNANGEILRTITIDGEISGHAFVEGTIHVLRGTEQNGENWSIARLDPRQERPVAKNLATIPFACRSLAFDGQQFWSNHRAGNETISFVLPLSQAAST